MTRSTADDWLALGLGVLTRDGEGALTIERLCREMGKSKGSFYHHFSDMNGYIGRLLDFWEQRQTQQPIEIAERCKTAKEKLQALDTVVSGLDHDLEQIIRHWARRDDRANRAVHRVDEIRIAYVAKLLGNAGVAEKAARLVAELEYTFFLGAEQRFRDLQSQAAREHLAQFRRLLGVANNPA